MTREEIAQRLSDLVQNETSNEKDCGELLKEEEGASILLQGNQNLVFIGAELRTSSGDVDLLIHCEEDHLSGDKRRKLSVWELKAPQLYLFKIENNSRACPTPDLYSAENQLLHYHYQLKNTREKYNIISPEDVDLGGIIIGREDTYVKNTTLPPYEAKALATIAYNVRDNNFYGKRLKLWTWDQIISSLKIITANNLSRKSVERIQISVSESISVSVEEGTSVN